MKKIFTILLVAVACFALSSCGVKKGDGSRFYAEYAGAGKLTFCIQHSTMHCPAIKNGTRNCKNFDWYYFDDWQNTFCSKCMDEELIEKWYELFELKDKKDK